MKRCWRCWGCSTFVGVGITEYVPEIEHDARVLDQLLGALDLSPESS